MLKITISVHPFGKEEDKYNIKEYFIANTLITSKTKGHKYKVWCKDPRYSNDDVDKNEKNRLLPHATPKCVCEVWHHRSKGAEELSIKCIKKVKQYEEKERKEASKNKRKETQKRKNLSEQTF